MAKVGSNNTFINTLLAATSFINGVAEKMPSRLGFFGVYNVVYKDGENKAYFKFADYSIKGKYPINSDRNAITIEHKMLSIKVRGNFNGKPLYKKCSIYAEIIDENGDLVFSAPELYRVETGTDANGTIMETHPFNCEYILDVGQLDSQSYYANKTFSIRFYVEFDEKASFYSASSWGDCSVTITEI